MGGACRYKGLCLQRAQAAGVATARLPIQKHVKLEASAVLTVNHVVQVSVHVNVVGLHAFSFILLFSNV